MSEDLSDPLCAGFGQELSLDSRFRGLKSSSSCLAVKSIEDVDPFLAAQFLNYARHIFGMDAAQPVLGDRQSYVTLGAREVWPQGLNILLGYDTPFRRSLRS